MPVPENLAKTSSAAALAAKIRRKELSPVEVMDAAAARIEAHNSKINALIILHLDEARTAAKAAEAQIMRGACPFSCTNTFPVRYPVHAITPSGPKAMSSAMPSGGPMRSVTSPVFGFTA